MARYKTFFGIYIFLFHLWFELDQFGLSELNLYEKSLVWQYIRVNRVY